MPPFAAAVDVVDEDVELKVDEQLLDVVVGLTTHQVLYLISV